MNTSVNLQTKYRSNFCRAASTAALAKRVAVALPRDAAERDDFADYRPFQNAPLKRINIVTTGAFRVHSSGCTSVGAAIVAGNYIGLTAGNKGKLRLKPPTGAKGNGSVGGRERRERGRRKVTRDGKVRSGGYKGRRET